MRTQRPTLHRRGPRAAITGILLLFVLLPAAPGLADRAERAALKAQFITRIARFVEWPEGSFETDASPIRIGVLGESRLIDALRKEVGSAKAGKRRFEIETLENTDEASEVHIVVVADANDRKLGRMARALKGSGALTFGPSFTFAERGGTLGMEIFRGKVAFEVNNRAAEDANLRISSKVLKLATTVY